MNITEIQQGGIEIKILRHLDNLAIGALRMVGERFRNLHNIALIRVGLVSAAT